MELDSILMMHYILANQQEICLVLKISAKIDIILKTMNEGDKESLYITSIIYEKNIVVEKLPTFIRP